MEKNSKNCNKISGYLEKKGKKKMISSYKKYWFVLEGGLLLYYRSKDDYETISPCKGSINLGPPCIIKPCPSTTGVFQVQTRIATVTLRAENRDEQNKWMHAIISEINPQKSLQRMSHFRYSMENIQQSKEQNRNSTPESESSHNSNEDIIQRLQKMGAQSYNPIGTINKIATLRQKDRTPLPNFNFDNTLNNRDSKSSEHIYERISAEFKEALLDEEKEFVEVTKKSMTLPTQSFNTLKIKREENRPKTFIIENDEYAISIQQKEKMDDTKTIQKNAKKSENKEDKNKDKKSKKKLKYTKSFFSKREPKEECFIVENDAYATVQKGNITLDDNKEIRDHNENNLLKEESRKFQEENAYSIPNFFDEAAKSEELYEDLEKSNVEYAEPCLLQEEEQNKKKDATEEKDKKKSKIKKKKHEEIDPEKGTKLKKKPSFMKRVWRKREKNKDKNKIIEKNDESIEVEELYETVPATVVEKVCFTDSTAVQMLSELQNILEQKMPILIEKISSSPTKSEPPEELFGPIKNIEKTIASEENGENGENAENADFPQIIPEPPLLQEKTEKLDSPSPAQDVPRNKPLTLPPKKNKRLENVKSLDEILDELDTQKSDSHKNKVKKLIKRFSEPEFSENDVVLRNRKNGNREEIDSSELSRLLEELAKVTNAPILIPGVTSSLNSANIPDEELSKLLPTKQRRFSEPDYDIPRPHKSLTITQKRDVVSENVIGSTRFFGPILKPSDMIVSSDRNPVDSPSQLDSITPDSLETNVQHIPPPVIVQESDETYPHKYYKFVDRRTFYNKNHLSYPPHLEKKLEDGTCVPSFFEDKQNEFIVENEIYAEPRSISMHFELSHDKSVEYEHNDEVFVDSLEICKNEVSTEF